MRLFEVENWRVGAIARQLRVRHEPVRQVLKQADVGPAPIAPRANHVSANVDSRRSLLVSLWFEGVEGNVLLGPDQPALPVAAVDRLVHHSTILEMNVDSYRRRAALPARR